MKIGSISTTSSVDRICERSLNYFIIGILPLKTIIPSVGINPSHRINSYHEHSSGTGRFPARFRLDESERVLGGITHCSSKPITLPAEHPSLSHCVGILYTQNKRSFIIGEETKTHSSVVLEMFLLRPTMIDERRYYIGE